MEEICRNRNVVWLRHETEPPLFPNHLTRELLCRHPVPEQLYVAV